MVAREKPGLIVLILGVMGNLAECLLRSGHLYGSMSSQVRCIHDHASLRAAHLFLSVNTFWHPIDLTTLFNWNTKQIFVYITAEYTNSRGVSAAVSKDVPTVRVN